MDCHYRRAFGKNCIAPTLKAIPLKSRWCVPRLEPLTDKITCWFPSKGNSDTTIGNDKSACVAATRLLPFEGQSGSYRSSIGLVPTNALAATELSISIDWPETLFWEVRGGRSAFWK